MGCLVLFAEAILKGQGLLYKCLCSYMLFFMEQTVHGKACVYLKYISAVQINMCFDNPINFS